MPICGEHSSSQTESRPFAGERQEMPGRRGFEMAEVVVLLGPVAGQILPVRFPYRDEGEEEKRH